MAQWYINAESVTQDGLTPATGYHNFTSLITAHGALLTTDFVDVVATVTPVTQSANVTLSGTIRAYVAGTLPVIDTSAGSTPRTIALNSSTSFSGLRVKCYITSYNVPAFAPSQAITSNTVIDSCFIDNIGTAEYLWWGPNRCSNLTIRNCALWHAYAVGDYMATWSAGQQIVYVNNSIVTLPSSTYFFFSPLTNLQCFIYNIAVKGSLPSFSLTGAPNSLIDYFKTSQASYTIASGAVTIGTHNTFSIAPANLFPADASSKDFSLTASSWLIDTGVTNSYTPTVDILGKDTYGLKDVGAYEYVPTCWSFTAKYKNTNKMFKLQGSENNHPRDVRVPGNIDMGSICMLEHGRFIPSTEYKIL